MTSPKDMDELLWGKEFEAIHDWVERLEMATKVRGIDEQKMFKIGKLNFRDKSKEWFKKLVVVLTNWQAMKVVMLLKYGIMDKEKSRLNWIISNNNPNKGFKHITTKWKHYSQGAS
jgi:hypothetical protein